MQEYNQKWQERVGKLESKLKDVLEKSRHERALAKDEQIHQNSEIRKWRQRVLSADKKNEILSTLLDQQRKSAEVKE